MIHVNSHKSANNIKWWYGLIGKKISCPITCTSSNTYYDTIWSAQALAVTSLALRYLSHISKCPPFGKRRYLCWRWQLEDFIAKAHKVIWSFYAMHSMYVRGFTEETRAHDWAVFVVKCLTEYYIHSLGYSSRGTTTTTARRMAAAAAACLYIGTTARWQSMTTWKVTTNSQAHDLTWLRLCWVSPPCSPSPKGLGHRDNLIQSNVHTWRNNFQ